MKDVFNTFNTATDLFSNYKGVRLCPTVNWENSVSSTFFRKENSWLQKQKRPHQTWETVEVTQQPPEVAKPLENQVQATESNEKAEAVVDEEVVTKDVVVEAGTSTAQNTRHRFVTSREK